VLFHEAVTNMCWKFRSVVLLPLMQLIKCTFKQYSLNQFTLPQRKKHGVLMVINNMLLFVNWYL